MSKLSDPGQQLENQFRGTNDVMLWSADAGPSQEKGLSQKMGWENGLSLGTLGPW